MKASVVFTRAGVCHASAGWLAAMLVLIGTGSGPGIGRAQPPGGDTPGTEVLTRGPVHEAFAGIVTFDPEPGVMVTKAPPEVIEEMPPDVRPEGDNVTWIPGYWAWDDERNDYLWVSGTWRALPPGRAWIAGYWGQVPQGYQWTSGYWADAAERETTYLPPPPATVEMGPNIEAPSLDYGWTPGCWVWYHGRYAWSPGYWAQGRADWDWMPAHYLWTPRGFIFVGGFWDYSIGRRGVLFAPVYFGPGVYSRRGYFYSPTIVINVGVFDDCLFLRPRYNHYYFGDYYAPNYRAGGFYASFSFQSGHYGYDPIFSHQRWEHRQDRSWEHHVEDNYRDRTDHESARPPRTWAAQNMGGPDRSKSNRELMATPIDQMARAKGGPMKFQTVAKEERQTLAQRGHEVQQTRDQRRTVESKAMDTTARKPGATFEPVKVQLPKSSIVAKPASQFGKNQAPPKLQRPSKADPKIQPKAESSGRLRDVDRTPQAEPRKSGANINRAPGKGDTLPHETQVQPMPQPSARESTGKIQTDSQPTVRGFEKPAQQAPVRPPRSRPDLNEKGATKLMQREKPANRKLAAPESSQARPSAGGNPADNERAAQPNPREKASH